MDAVCFSLGWCSLALGFRQRLERLSRPHRRTAAIRSPTRPRGTVRSAASQLVSTRQPALPTRPLVIKPSTAAQPATATQPPVPLRSRATQPAAAIRPTVKVRSHPAQPATTTRLPVLELYRAQTGTTKRQTA